MQACKKAGLDEIFFTMWGDDGAYCDFDSALAGMAYVSELMYCDKVSQKTLARRFAAICGGDYEAVCLASRFEYARRYHVGRCRLSAIRAVRFSGMTRCFAIYYRNKALQQPNYWPKLRTHYKKLIGSLD